MYYVCMYVCMYVCSYVCMYVRHTLIIAWAMYVLGVRSPQDGPRRVLAWSLSARLPLKRAS